MRLKFLFFIGLFYLLSMHHFAIGQVVIADIQTEGNKKTKLPVILRELPFKSGDTLPLNFLSNQLETAKNQLINLNLFNKVDIVADSSDPNKVVVIIRLTEKWYFWPIPTLEYADRNVNQWYTFKLDPERVNYGLYNFWYNVAGLNHTFKISLIHGYTRNYGLEYRVPYWDKLKRWGGSIQASRRLNHELVFATSENKQQFYKNPEINVNQRNSISAMLQYRPGIFTRFYLNPGYFHQRVDENVLKLNPEFNAIGNEYMLYYAGLGIQYQKTNNKNYPTEGVLAGGNVNFNLLAGQNQRFTEISAWGEIYQPLGHKTSAALFSGCRFRTHAQLPYLLTSALGFRYYVRGYEPYVIEGRNYFLMKGEGRFDLLNNRLFNFSWIPLKNYRDMITSAQLCIFGDAGYVVNKDSYLNWKNNMQNRWLTGAGIGCNWVIYFDKVVRFEYSVNHMGEFYGNIHFTKPF